MNQQCQNQKSLLLVSSLYLKKEEKGTIYKLLPKQETEHLICWPDTIREVCCLLDAQVKVITREQVQPTDLLLLFHMWDLEAASFSSDRLVTKNRICWLKYLTTFFCLSLHWQMLFTDPSNRWVGRWEWERTYCCKWRSVLRPAEGNLKIYKSMSPDQMQPWDLRELSDIITKLLSIIFENSWWSDEVPGEKRQCYVHF